MQSKLNKKGGPKFKRGSTVWIFSTITSHEFIIEKFKITSIKKYYSSISRKVVRCYYCKVFKEDGSLRKDGYWYNEEHLNNSKEKAVFCALKFRDSHSAHASYKINVNGIELAKYYLKYKLDKKGAIN